MGDKHLREWAYPVGSNADVDGAAAEDVWAGGGVYSFPAAAGATTLVSGSAADAAAGTGARSIEVVGLLAGGVLARETVVPTGTDAVALTNAFFRILDARVRSAGSGAVNAGAITIAIGGAAAGVLPAGSGRLNAAIYTVPGDRAAYLAGGRLTAGAATAGVLTGSLLIRPSGEAWQTVDLLEVASQVSGTQALDTATGTVSLARTGHGEFEFEGMLYLAPLTDVRVSVAASVNNMVAIASLSLMLAAAF
ncbi:hypothetical protein [uncultured Thiodictyon sp.]|uniref:hypothetical protein n=1 Tax=uncultured Thiodictyon sp. TaxID=1846217 RepID=UPI0025F48F27|nr:hypothetical protein [uncultured Thiodictyon sp.]